jgi:cytochrome b
VADPDLGLDRFDGAWLAHNIEGLKPETAIWDKYANLFTHIDTRAAALSRLRALVDGFYRLSSEEMVAIENVQSLHQPVGYAILGLLALRIVWGFIGSRHSRFADFIRSPGATLACVRDLLAGKAPRSRP